jgi:hypothetical protein
VDADDGGVFGTMQPQLVAIAMAVVAVMVLAVMRKTYA